jgi:hypothetical protein
VVAYSFLLFHYPIWIFWDHEFSLTLFIAVVILNCCIYAYLIERLIWFARSSGKVGPGAR